MRKLAPLVVLALVAAFASASPQSSHAGSPVVDYTVPAARDADPVVLTGKDFPGWAVPANATAKLPLVDLTGDPVTGDPPPGQGCTTFDAQCQHNHYATPDFNSQDVAPQKGPAINRFLGYRWNAKAGRFVQIPFQVDEVFTRYLDNSASGFSVYSGNDQHTTYAFDREGWRMYGQDPNNPCHAVPAGGVKTTPDPVQGLDTNDELAFMASDAGAQAPAGTSLPKGIVGAREVKIADPTNPGNVKVVYVMETGVTKHGQPTVKPAYTAANGYVRYMRDSNADDYVYSQSSYDGYGNARTGMFMWDGQCVGANPTDPGVAARCANAPTDPPPGVTPNDPPTDSLFFQCPQRRRPADTATITTPRYRFRYDGRWLMTDVRISPNDDWTYGPDLVDRWKARAFAQDPGSETPCCGYEEEDTNWGGSSTLLGEKVGPVRAIRETWGSDSGTNVVRRETFYRDQMVQKTWLRVHVIPPLDGIYAQWDFNAGRMTRYYSSRTQATQPDGVPIDGKNDEMLGNLDDPCNTKYDQNTTSQLDQTIRQTYRTVPALCSSNQLGGQNWPYHQSIDLTDPSLQDANAALGWNVTAGPWGSIVDRIRIDQATDETPGGAAQSLFAEPYYRDDSCFDDGTGSDPGPKMHLRSADEPSVAPDGTPRKCWTPADGIPTPENASHFYQGDIGTHGLHLLFLADSDNARQTVPVDEIVSDWQMVMLHGQQTSSAGEQYGRSFEKPLVTAVVPFSASGSSSSASDKKVRAPRH